MEAFLFVNSEESKEDGTMPNANSTSDKVCEPISQYGAFMWTISEMIGKFLNVFNVVDQAHHTQGVHQGIHQGA